MELTNNITIATDLWSTPERVDVIEHHDRIEFVYKQVSMVTFTSGYNPQPLGKRCYKIIFSVVDGRWHKSDPIFGKIIPQQEETYEFEV